MDWFTWLSQTPLDPSLVYDYGAIFSSNELTLKDVAHFDHELLLTLGIHVAKHRIEILKLAKGETRKPSFLKRVVKSVSNAARRKWERCAKKLIRLEKDPREVSFGQKVSPHYLEWKAAGERRADRSGAMDFEGFNVSKSPGVMPDSGRRMARSGPIRKRTMTMGSNMDFGPGSNMDYGMGPNMDYGVRSNMDYRFGSNMDYGPGSNMVYGPVSNMVYGPGSKMAYGMGSNMDYGLGSNMDYGPRKYVTGPLGKHRMSMGSNMDYGPGSNMYYGLDYGLGQRKYVSGPINGGRPKKAQKMFSGPMDRRVSFKNSPGLSGQLDESQSPWALLFDHMKPN